MNELELKKINVKCCVWRTYTTKEIDHSRHDAVLIYSGDVTIPEKFLDKLKLSNIDIFFGNRNDSHELSIGSFDFEDYELLSNTYFDPIDTNQNLECVELESDLSLTVTYY